MPKPVNTTAPAWVEGDLRLVGALDGRMIGLLSAIAQSGSINQAAKQVGLSYKGAWQMIERANNLAPKVLVATATGGSKGGGTQLTTAGMALLRLFGQLTEQHQHFISQLNQELAANGEMHLLFKRLAIKTSATNQLFGTVTAIEIGSGVHAEVKIGLKGGETVIASLAIAELETLGVVLGSDVVMLINDAEIIVGTQNDDYSVSARNRLGGTVIRIRQDGTDAVLALKLASGDTLMATITQSSAETLALKLDDWVYAVFKSNAVILGI